MARRRAGRVSPAVSWAPVGAGQLHERAQRVTGLLRQHRVSLARSSYDGAILAQGADPAACPTDSMSHAGFPALP